MQVVPSSETRTGLQSVGLAIAGLAATIALLYYGRAFWITLVVSVILAFMLEPFVGMFMSLRLPRGVASLIVCMMALAFLYLLGLASYTQLAFLADDLPEYSNRINEIVDNVADRIERTEQEAYKIFVPKRFQAKEAPQPEPPPAKTRRQRRDVPPPPAPVQEIRLHEDRPSLMNYITAYLTSMYNVLLMGSFVPFLVYFMLSQLERLGGRFFDLYVGQTGRLMAGRSWQVVARMVRAYVVGNVILGVILSLASCIVFYTWHLPYWVLLGFVSGFLSLIPYIGLPLAVIPALAGTLMTYNAVTPHVIVSAEVAVLHLLALNFLYPVVVGARVHLNPLAVTIALMFWGSIWGGIGFVLAIPITASLKAFLDNTEGYQALGRLLGD